MPPYDVRSQLQDFIGNGLADGEAFVPFNFREHWENVRRCYSAYGRTLDEAELRAALQGWELIHRHPDFGGAPLEFRLATLIGAGDLSVQYTLLTNDPRYLPLGARCYGEAARHSAPGSGTWVESLHEQAGALLLFSELTNSYEDLRRAAQVWEQALPSARAYPALALEIQIRLGTALGTLHTRRRLDQLDLDEEASALERNRSLLETETYELERGISLLEDAWSRVPPGSPLYFECLAHLGNALTWAYGRRGEATYLDRAIELLEQGLTQPPPPDCMYAPYLPFSLGAQLIQRYQRGHSAADLDRAIELLGQALLCPPDMELDRCKAFLQLAGALSDRYRQQRNPLDLRRALDAYEKAVAAPDPTGLFKSNALDGHGNALKLRYEASGDPADLDAAIRQWQQATADHSAFLFLHLGHLAEGLEARFKRTGDLADLTRAIEVTRQTIEEDALGLSAPELRDSLAQRLVYRYERSRNLPDLDEAIRVWDEALDDHKVEDNIRSTLLHNLSKALKIRYERRGDNADYDRAAQLALLAREATPPDASEEARDRMTLAHHLFEEYEREDEPELLDAAIENLEQALGLAGKNSAKYYVHLAELGSMLATRGVERHDAAEIDRAIGMIREAVAKTSSDTASLPNVVGLLSSALVDCFDLKQESADIEEAIGQAERAVSLTPQGAIDMPRRVYNLAQLYARRYRYAGRVEDSARAEEFYKSAALDGVNVDTETALRSSRLWGESALERGAWAEAVEAYRHAQAHSEKTFEIQLVRRSKEAWLQFTQGLSARMAYALTRTGELQQAVMTLEAGAARLITESSEYGRADLVRLRDGVHIELHERYQRAEADWNRLAELERRHDPGGRKGIVPTDVLRSARAELDSVVEQIREVPGFENFHRGYAFADVQKACGDGPLVYVAVTPVGGLALTVSASTVAGVTPLWLPDLTEGSLTHALYGDMARSTLGGYLGAYTKWGATGEWAVYDGWRAALDRVTGWLWNVLMGPLTRALRGTPRAYLIPIGELGLLPLHAAWTADAASPTGRRYALDEVAFAYAPNARGLGKAKSVAAGIEGEALLAVEEPQPVNASSLPGAAYEVQAAVKTFRRAKVLRRGEATRAAVLSSLPDCTVLHFAGHSHADLVNPSSTGLVLAEDEEISVADLLSLRLKGIRLAVLSSCETGVAGVHLADEMFSLSSGLLQAGVAGVAASLWRVGDASTMLLMFLFYQLWREEGRAPAAALRDAQLWVRDKTNGEKATYFKSFMPEFGGSGKYAAVASRLYRTVATKPKEGRDFAGPDDWAAFAYFGV